MSAEQQAKSALRQQLRATRRALPATTKAEAATAIAGLAGTLPGWDAAVHIALYWPNDGEVDPQHLANRCRNEQRHLYLPTLCEDNRLLFRRWDANTRLVPNRFGIPEPESCSPQCNAAGMDVIFMPLVGWRRDGYRLGMGGGFYDRTLAGLTGPLRVGLGFSCQEINHGTAAEPWDVALDYVLTEAGLICRTAGTASTS
jgi:5-formyltetrahydrofolate cyclo-ligase